MWETFLLLDKEDTLTQEEKKVGKIYFVLSIEELGNWFLTN